MAEICPTCGLPKDICVCTEISKEQQRIKIRRETRKFGKPTTIIEGINDKDQDLSRLAQKLKTFCACGGTAKNNQIILQGDQRDRVKTFLIRLGFPEQNIELQWTKADITWADYKLCVKYSPVWNAENQPKNTAQNVVALIYVYPANSIFGFCRSDMYVRNVVTKVQ